MHPRPQDPQALRGRARAFAAAVALALLVVLAYARVAGNGFIDLDDNDYVTQNLRVQAGITWKGILWALTTGHSANWHPLTWLSHQLDCELFGLDPRGPHLVNLAIHLASTLLLLSFFLRATRSLGASLFVAAAFGLHPLHVESVAWVAERKDVLSAFFWILSMHAYVRWTERPGRARFAVLLGVYALGLLSKPMLVTLPCALLLLDHWPLGRGRAVPFGRRCTEKLPLFLLAAASSAVTFLVQEARGAMALGDQIPLGLRAQNALVAYGAYLRKSLLPTDLAVYYPHPIGAYPGARVAIAVLVLAAVSLLAWRAARTRPWIAVGWLWFLGTLVPVIGLVQVGSQAMADRYTYVPMIGLAFAVAYSAQELAGRTRAARAASLALLVLLAGAWTALAWRQVGFWKDDRTLFQHVADVQPENHLAHGILGNVHLREGRLREAMAEFQTALRARPGYAEGHSNLGMALELAGRPDEAVKEYETALRWSPGLVEAHHNLGRLLAREGKLPAAIAHLEVAVRASPDLVNARYNLGLALVRARRFVEAVPHLERALELRPGFAEARALLDAARAGRVPPG